MRTSNKNLTEKIDRRCVHDKKREVVEHFVSFVLNRAFYLKGKSLPRWDDIAAPRRRFYQPITVMKPDKNLVSSHDNLPQFGLSQYNA